jgi:D-glycero-D-manno-heptose 1,7-bisphosphate phosphatase
MFGPRRAVFLDRDGVLVVPQFREGRSFAPTTLAEFAIYPDAPRCVARLKEAGFFTVVVSNQPDVGAGRVARELVDEMSVRLRRAMPLDAIKICCHTNASPCACRKPRPGMLLEAAREIGLDLKESFMVGDRASDVEAGAAAGCRTVFIDLGYTAEQPPERPNRIVGSLSEAADWILSMPQEHS